MALLIDVVEERLKECLCRMLEEDGRPVCGCHFYHGDSPPPADRCGVDGQANGQAWVRRVGTEQSSSQDVTSWGGDACGDVGGSYEIEYGVYRCIQAVPTDDGRRAPDIAAYDMDRALAIADYRVLAEVSCCPEFLDLGVTVTLVSASPTGPAGACAGWVFTLTLSGNPMEEFSDDDEGGPGVQRAPSGFVSGPAGEGDEGFGLLCSAFGTSGSGSTRSRWTFC